MKSGIGRADGTTVTRSALDSKYIHPAPGFRTPMVKVRQGYRCRLVARTVSSPTSHCMNGIFVSDSSSNSGSSRTPRPKRGGLGRGLGSLIPTTPLDPVATETGAATTIALPIDKIAPNPYQPRKVMDPDKLQDLADSIRVHGLVQPLIVTEDREGNRYLLIAGERRWRAAAMAGLSDVPVVVREAVPQDMLELAIIENLVRADLGPLEEAASFRQLIDEFGLSQSQVAARVGRSRTAVANTLRLLNAPDQVQAALASEAISEGHARAILGLASATDQLALLQTVIDQGLNVRQTEALVRRQVTAPQPPATERPARPADEVRLEDRLRTALGTRVALKRTSDGRGGSLTIQFFSDDQLQTIYDKLVGEDIW